MNTGIYQGMSCAKLAQIQNEIKVETNTLAIEVNDIQQIIKKKNEEYTAIQKVIDSKHQEIEVIKNELTELAKSAFPLINKWDELLGEYYAGVSFLLNAICNAANDYHLDMLANYQHKQLPVGDKMENEPIRDAFSELIGEDVEDISCQELEESSNVASKPALVASTTTTNNEEEVEDSEYASSAECVEPSHELEESSDVVIDTALVSSTEIEETPPIEVIEEVPIEELVPSLEVSVDDESEGKEKIEENNGNSTKTNDVEYWRVKDTENNNREIPPKALEIIFKDFTTGKKVFWWIKDSINEVKDSNVPKYLSEQRVCKKIAKKKKDILSPTSKDGDVPLNMICCDKASLLVDRLNYDNPYIPLDDRNGLIDKKMRKVNGLSVTMKDWESMTKDALKTTYGYEPDGNVLAVSRVYILFSVADWFEEKFPSEPISCDMMENFANIISHNVIQMDGNNLTIPKTDIPAKIMNWDTKEMESISPELAKTIAEIESPVITPYNVIGGCGNYVRPLSDGIMETLLKDHTTGKNIIWVNKDYSYPETSEMNLSQIKNAKTILPRAHKPKDCQKDRTKKTAEVFTPLEIVKKMNDQVDEKFDGSDMEYIQRRVLEVTCGEAPFLVNRYDPITGHYIHTGSREGLLDRKLKIVNKNAKNVGNWTKLATIALKSTYGYELQGDNLLIARVNILNTMADYFEGKFPYGAPVTEKMMLKFADIISRNIIQMDGVCMTIPMSDIPAKVMNWETNEMECFNSTTKISAIKKDAIPTSGKKKTGPIYQKDENGNVVAVYAKSQEASKYTGINNSSIRKSYGNFPKYKRLLANDGKYYTFERTEKAETVSCNKPTRSYNKKKIVVVNRQSNEISIYDNVIKASEALGVNKDDIYYHLKAKNHMLNDTYEVMYEDNYKVANTD